MLRFMTAGESHGKGLAAILEGLPAGVPVEADFVDRELRRRQLGYGRGGRMRIERDQVEFLSGIRHGHTMGSPICLEITNRDWVHWEDAMSSAPAKAGTNLRPVTRPRPGHADLAGALKYLTPDVRNILERASARESAARVAVGAICKRFLLSFGIRVVSHTLAVGSVQAEERFWTASAESVGEIDPESEIRCLDQPAQRSMMEQIDKAKSSGDSLGGIFEVIVSGAPPGLGSHIQWDRKLDGLLAQALMSIPAAKAVEIGDGIRAADGPGSAFHDEVFYDATSRRFYRETNRAGGLEGGISNGSDIRARVYMKPIPTLRKPLRSVDLHTKAPYEAAYERSDTCVLPAAGVIGEAMAAFVVARALLEKFGGDSLAEVLGNYRHYLESVRAL